MNNTEDNINQNLQAFSIPKLVLNYPIPLPLQVIDEVADWYDFDFMVANTQESFLIDESGIIFNSTNGLLTPMDIHTNDFSFFVVYTSPSKNGKDIILEFSSKFTDGKLTNTDLIWYSINDSSIRIKMMEDNLKQAELNNKKWSYKYIFSTKWYFYTVIKFITFLKNLTDMLYHVGVENIQHYRPTNIPNSGCGCSGKK